MTTAPTTIESARSIERHDRAHQLARRIMDSFFDFAAVASEIIQDKDYERYGYVDHGAYFLQEHGVKSRTLYRYLRAYKAHAMLPVADQPAAREAMVALGSHKAEILAAVITRDGEDWRAWLTRAAEIPASELQEEVNAAVGLRPRGAQPAPGEVFYRMVLAHVPPDAQERVSKVFDAIAAEYECRSRMGAFLTMVEIAVVDLAASGRLVE